MMRLQLLGDPALITQLQQVSRSYSIFPVRPGLISPAHRQILNSPMLRKRIPTGSQSSCARHVRDTSRRSASWLRWRRIHSTSRHSAG